ncbi:MAG TPA: lysophospholipase [Candidatus Blautia stercorigallinarum]|uniref:Lysophospholipase n=1 Tax=Candidatus Blautia stercorigallinarum TaxID=2838501 RepID=A0A9D1PDB8_9FIRM|nr:lysophospholipase [Candidatus Blautia stercorigallinarum]
MKEEKFIFLSADNKTTIHGTWWEPEQLPKAVLQISHGLTEYGQRYRDFAEFLIRYGYAVAANDVIGHGKSVTPGEEPVHIEKWEDTVKDFETCRRKTGERFGDLPYYTMGFSLGSFILQSYLTEHAAGIQGIILAGTGMIPDFQLKAAKAYVKYIGKKAGMNRKDPRIHELSFGTYNKHFDGGKKVFSWLYADETCRLAYEKEQKGSEDMVSR